MKTILQRLEETLHDYVHRQSDPATRRDVKELTLLTLALAQKVEQLETRVESLEKRPSGKGGSGGYIPPPSLTGL